MLYVFHFVRFPILIKLRFQVCSSSLVDTGALDPVLCTKSACPGDSSEACGGPGSLLVYGLSG
jgi:hypothetical protein